MGCVYCDPYVFVGIEVYQVVNSILRHMKRWHNVFVPSSEVYDIYAGPSKILVGQLTVTASDQSQKGTCEQQETACVPTSSCKVVVDDLIFNPDSAYPDATLTCVSMGAAGETPGCENDSFDEYLVEIPSLSLTVVVTICRTCSACTQPLIGPPDDEFLDEV